MKKILIFLTTLLLTASCKKETESKQECFIAVITPSTPVAVVNLYYTGGKLAAIKAAEHTTTFEYKGDSIIALQKKAYDFSERRVYKMAGTGLPSSVKKENNIAGTQFSNWIYEYNGTEIQKLSISASTSPAVLYSYTYTWSDGNLVSENSELETRTYEYYTDLPCQRGDALYIDAMKYDGGIEYIRNRNLLKKITYTSPAGTYNIQYEYTFDSGGKIKTVKSSRYDPALNNTIIYDLQYLCN